MTQTDESTMMNLGIKSEESLEDTKSLVTQLKERLLRKVVGHENMSMSSKLFIQSKG
jgi:hypothetical protein